MAFNIKNEETIQIARLIAFETGSSIASVFDEAIRKQQLQLKRDKEAKRQRLMELAVEIRERMPSELMELSDPIASTLYDSDTGLPL